MIKIKRFLFPFTTITLGIILFISSLSIKQMKSMTYNIGSAIVPRILSIVLIIFGVLALYLDVKNGNKKDESVEQLDKRQKVNIVLTFLALLAYIMIIDKLGFIVSSILYLIAQILIMTENINTKRVIKTAMISLVSTVVIYIIFVYAFQLRLPMGLLG